MHGTFYTRILALDLGKFDSVLCIFDPATAAHSFVSLASDRHTIHDRLVEHMSADPPTGTTRSSWRGWPR